MLEECCLGGSLLPPPYCEPPPAYVESPPPAYVDPASAAAPLRRVVIDLDDEDEDEGPQQPHVFKDQEEEDMQRALAESLLPQPGPRAKRPARGNALYQEQYSAIREAAVAEAKEQAEQRARRAKARKLNFEF